MYETDRGREALRKEHITAFTLEELDEYVTHDAQVEDPAEGRPSHGRRGKLGHK